MVKFSSPIWGLFSLKHGPVQAAWWDRVRGEPEALRTQLLKTVAYDLAARDYERRLAPRAGWLRALFRAVLAATGQTDRFHTWRHQAYRRRARPLRGMPHAPS